MSFDVYFQPLASGDAGTTGRDAVVGVLSPYLWPSPDAPTRIVHPEGTADVYGLTDDSMMVNHIEGAGLWSLLVEAARAGRWAIMPIGCALRGSLVGPDLLLGHEVASLSGPTRPREQQVECPAPVPS
jgi:hypothetical protein